MDDPNYIDKGRQPAYQKIADGLRYDILGGKYPPGSLLPSTEEFAGIWKSSYFTVHTALKSLVKEGWVERIHGQGTYVAQTEKRFLHAGIYHSLNIWSDEEATFQRRLNDCLVEKFHGIGKTAHIIVDSRPESGQDAMLPALAQAIFNRQIQCIVAPNVNSKSLPLLSRLTMPVAFMTTRAKHPGVDMDHPAFMRGSVQALADQGCRSIGFITNFPASEGSIESYFRAIAELGLETRDEWVIRPPEFPLYLIDYGYHSFRRLSKLPRLPEGLIVYPDVVARGVITAILASGMRVPEQMKLIFHRNAHARLLCPFPVTWAITDEGAVADGLIQSLEKQFEGERPEKAVIPYRFEQDDARRWLS